jgi:hypothetical protein
VSWERETRERLVALIPVSGWRRVDWLWSDDADLEELPDSKLYAVSPVIGIVHLHCWWAKSGYDDGDRLENRTKSRTLLATNAHVSCLAAITPDELQRKVSATELANGYLNRFLLIAVSRSKLLPDPPLLPNPLVEEHAAVFQKALDHGRRMKALRRDKEASALWSHAYKHELAIDRGGLVGAVCSRAEPHTLRLSLIYALLDCAEVIRVEHVAAGLALWRYAEASAYLAFGDQLGDPAADALLAALKGTESQRIARTSGLAGRVRQQQVQGGDRQRNHAPRQGQARSGRARRAERTRTAGGMGARCRGGGVMSGLSSADLARRVAELSHGNRYLATTPRRLDPLLAEMPLVVQRDAAGCWVLTKWGDATVGRALREASARDEMIAA